MLLLSRNEAYTALSWVVAAPLTTSLRQLDTTVILTPELDGVDRESCVTLDHLLSVRIADLSDFVVRLSEERMRGVDAGIAAALALPR